MHRLVMNQYAERTLLIACPNPLETLVGNDIRKIATLYNRIALHRNETRIVVITLLGNYLPIIKTCRQCTEMPLTDDGRLITSLLQQLGERLLLGIEHAGRVIEETILRRMFTRQHTGSTRTTQRVGNKTIRKTNSVTCNAVEIGG